MSIVIDLFVLCLTCGFVVLGARLGLRRTILLGILAIPAAMVGISFAFFSAGGGTSGVFSPASLFYFLLSGGLVYLFLSLLLRLNPDRKRVGFIVQSILLRIPVTIAFLVATGFGTSLLLLGWGQAPTPHQIALYCGIVIVIVVGLHLFIGRLWQWRQSEPAWFLAAPGRVLGGMLGLGYALLLLVLLVRLSCSARFDVPTPSLPFLNEELADAPPLVVEPPPGFVASLVRSRLAWRFLDPADGWQSLLLSVRIPRLGTAIARGNMSGVRIPGYDSVSGWILPSKSSLARTIVAAPGHLIPGRPDCLVVRDSAGFSILQYCDTNWVSLRHIPFDNPYAQPERGRTAWCVGDVYDDGRDEIVAGDSNRLVVFQWQDTDFSRREYDFRYQIDNVTVGDVNNDGRNEIVLFASDEKLLDGFERERVCILRLGPTGIELLGNDLGRLGLGDNRVTPADELLAVADVENRHVSELLVYRPSDGESQPLSVYFLLSGNDNRLRILRTFSIANGRLITPKRAADLANAQQIGSDMGGPLAVARCQGLTVCLSRTFHIIPNEQPVGQVSLVAIEHSRLRVMGQLFPPISATAFLADVPIMSIAHFLQIDHSDQTAQLCWIDPDGNGPAALRIAPSWRAPPRYTLDRMPQVGLTSGGRVR